MNASHAYGLYISKSARVRFAASAAAAAPNRRSSFSQVARGEYPKPVANLLMNGGAPQAMNALDRNAVGMTLLQFSGNQPGRNGWSAFASGVAYASVISVSSSPVSASATAA